MLGLFFIGKYLEKALGAGRFLALYFSGALCGGLLWAILAAFQNSPEVLVGASASVMAVFAGFCIVYPPVPITFLLFFVLPISLRPLTMLKIAAALEFLGLAYTFAGGDAVVAYSAHIGGLVSGVAFVCALRRLKNAHFKSPFARSRAGWNPKGGRASDYPFKVNISDSKDLSREIDRILDKISRDGFASLSDEERETLRRARDSLK